MTYHTPELVLVGSAQGLVLAAGSDAGECPHVELPEEIFSRNDAEF